MAYYLSSSWTLLTGGVVTYSPTAYTIAAWIRRTVSTNQYLTCRSNSAGPSSGWTHEMRFTNTVSRFYMYDGSVKTVIGTTTLLPNTWYHVVNSAANSGQIRLYINGVRDGTPVSIGTMWTGGDRWYFGGGPTDGDGYSSFNGDIAYLAYWNVQLTDDEIWRLYRNTNRNFLYSIRPENRLFLFTADDLSEGIGDNLPWKEVTKSNVTQTITGTKYGKSDILSVA